MANYHLHLLKCSKDPLTAVLSLWFTVLALFVDRAVNGFLGGVFFLIFVFWRSLLISDDGEDDLCGLLMDSQPGVFNDHVPDVSLSSPCPRDQLSFSFLSLPGETCLWRTKWSTKVSERRDFQSKMFKAKHAFVQMRIKIFELFCVYVFIFKTYPVYSQLCVVLWDKNVLSCKEMGDSWNNI